jgi:hypothetical protein
VSPLSLLGAALRDSDPLTRDGALGALEGCSTFAPGLIRALRAELADAGCGDVLVEPYLESSGATLTADARHVLIGLGLAARLTRLVRTPPRLEPPFTKQRFSQFFNDDLAGWIKTQAHAVHQLSLVGSRLLGYGKALVAVEAGLADLRFVEVVRDVPVPDELTRDPELKEAYYGALDQALDPRKDRGRDAALVGLREFAKIGALDDPRTARARALLSELYAGSRIDALDRLLLPPLPALARDTDELEALAKLPTYYANELLARGDATDPKLLTALLERGLPATLRPKLDASGVPEVRRLYARALFALGQRYWRADDFARAAEVASGLLKDRTHAAEAELLGALAGVLRRGPKDAAEMMLRGPMLPPGVGNVAPVDAIANSTSPFAGLAAFDAGVLMSLVPQASSDPAYFRATAERFRLAAKLLKDPRQRAEAEQRAKAAAATAAAVAPK